MKTTRSSQRDGGLTRIEVLVIAFVLGALAVFLVPALLSSHRHPSRVNCVNCLKQDGLAFLIWSGDNNGKFPMEVPTLAGGAMEPAASGNAVPVFQVMSNELCTPKILICPIDSDHVAATNFGGDFSAPKISYFVGVDASTNNSQAMLCGDDNFERGGQPIKSGLQTISTNAMFFWSTARHNRAGNIGLADGSVRILVANSNLVPQVSQTGLATNRLAIP